MTKKTKRVKAQAAPYRVPQGFAETSDFIARIGKATRERERIETRMNERLAAIKAVHEKQAAPLKDEIEQLRKGVQTWCEAHRDELTPAGRRKFYRFAAGEVSWHLRPPKVTVRGVAKVIERLAALGLAQFLRVRTEIDKEAMLADPELACSVEGVKIGSDGEDFEIKPVDTELEEVAK